MYFLQQVTLYTAIPDKQKAKRKHAALSMFATFISPSIATHMVNLDDTTRAAIETAIQVRESE